MAPSQESLMWKGARPSPGRGENGTALQLGMQGQRSACEGPREGRGRAGLGARGGVPAGPGTPRGEDPRRGSAAPAAEATAEPKMAAAGRRGAPGPSRGGARSRRRAGNRRPPLAWPLCCLRRLPPAAAPRGESGGGSG